VHYWAHLQLVHRFRCYDNIAPIANVSECFYLLYAWFEIPSCPAVDNILAVMIVWRIEGRLLELLCAVLYTTVVHSDMQTFMFSFCSYLLV